MPKPKNPRLNSLLSLVGDQNTITIHKAVVDFCDRDRDAASMLEQLLYWTPRSLMGGWIAKSDKEWNEELYMSLYAVKKSREYLLGRELISVKLKRWNGTPTNHYKVILDALDKEWHEFVSRFSDIDESESSKSTNPNAPNQQIGNGDIDESLTETTQEISLENINIKDLTSLEIQMWTNLSKYLEKEAAKSTYDKYIEGSQFLGIHEGVAYVQAKDTYSRDLLEARFSDIFREYLGTKEVEFFLKGGT